MSEQLLIDRINEFKKRINYDSIYFSLDEKKFIVFQKITPEEFGLNNSLGLKLEEDTFNINENGVGREWIYINNEEILVVELFAYLNGYKFAMERLLKEATATTMTKIPFDKCPYNLGDINVSIIEEKYYRILWTHYNVFYSVKYTSNRIDIENLCKSINNSKNKFIVTDIEEYCPRFDEVVVSSPINKIGQEFTIYIVPAVGLAFKNKKKEQREHLSVEAIWDGKILSLEKEAPFFFRFKGIKEGKEKIKFILADIDALVCSKYEVNIIVNR